MEGEERIGLGGAAAVLDVPVETVQRLGDEGRLGAERDEEGGYTFSLSEVMDLSRELGAEAAEEEVFEGEVIGDEPPGSSPMISPSKISSSAASAPSSRERSMTSERLKV